jgi:prepilin-type N-terminal cleavage/methylation domain-containing protein
MPLKQKKFAGLQSTTLQQEKVQHKSGAGFTLIELIVVIFIIGMLSTVMMANFRAGEKQKRVQLGADQTLSAMRTLQNVVLSGKQIGSCPATPNYYASVAYSSSSVNLYCSGIVFQTIKMPSDVRIKASSISIVTSLSTNTAANGALIFIAAPFASMKACPSQSGDTCLSGIGSEAAFQTISFIIESLDQKFSRTITINGISGRFE